MNSRGFLLFILTYLLTHSLTLSLFFSTTSRGPCAKCQKPIANEGIDALDRVWHPQCFTCSKCDCTFPDRNFVELNNKPYCQKCANQVAAQQPHGSDPSSGSYIVRTKKKLSLTLTQTHTHYNSIICIWNIRIWNELLLIVGL
jgi:hypothetical protein